jgi:hypothetical protein
LIFQGFAHGAVMFGLRWLVVLRAVNENADARNTVSFIIEIRLNEDAFGGGMLRMVG